MVTHNGWQVVVLILVIAIGTQITRWLPFVVFPEKSTPPKFVTQLGKILPPAVIGLLVVYCLKGVQPLEAPYALPEVISIALIAFLHIRWKNSLVSIGVGTVVYILLTRLVFA